MLYYFLGLQLKLLKSSEVKSLSFVFSPSTVGEKQPMILKWRILSATNDLDRVSAVALPKLPISISNTDLKVASDTKFFPGLGTALIYFLLFQRT